MEKTYISNESFNSMSEKDLKCFVLVTSDGSDQYVIDWNNILENALDSIFRRTKQNIEDIDLTKYTNVELLDMYYDNNPSVNANNSAVLISEIVDGKPVIKKLYWS